jgi:acyl-CoA dehydrogenase
MGFQMTERTAELNVRLQAFMEEHVYPREHDWEAWCLDQDNLWQVPPWYDDLREKAKEQGLWNLFLPHEYEPWSPGLSNVEIAPLFETMSKVIWAQGVFGRDPQRLRHDRTPGGLLRCYQHGAGNPPRR